MKIDQKTLLRYFIGESSKEEKEDIHLWLESDETNRKRFIRERIRFDASLIVDENEVSVKHKRTGRKLRIVFNALKVASVIMLLVFSSYFYSNYRIKELGNTMQNIYAPPGSRAEVKLSEGSSVWLNSNSTLKYPGFFRYERVVELNGEGFFDISKDTEKPFIINTSKYNLQVLGTRFNIESYDNSPVFEVALFTGKVKLFKSNADSDTIFLDAGETATLIGDELVVSVTNYNLYKWKDGILVIEDESFGEIMALFEKYYDIKIEIKTDNVKMLGYSGKFRVVDGIDHALRVLQKDYRFTYKREENSNVIYIY
jgi:ferric-dicitrate binding protein FerR (iron transport regulator)